MSRPVICIENISKLYCLGEMGYRTLRESLNQWWKRRRKQPESASAPLGIDPAQAGPYPQSFWALRDISATIQRGEIVGVIGRNGAGKSTLLKILSRITEPTRGRAVIRGRVGSLLEVGAGFHPELSGRDNIFLNGAILGMRKAAIARQLDDIISFADVGAFIDTPVKRYSSGMYVRLAFAVAAHLEPEILIVDEVLAVGDSRFQKKCLGKMQDISTAHGRTVIFVSHNLEAVQRLCSHCLLLDRGRLVAYGPTRSVVAQYLGDNLPSAAAEKWIDVSRAPRDGTGEARFAQVRFTSHNVLSAGQAYSDGPVEFSLAIDAKTSTQVQSISACYRDDFGRPLVSTDIGVFGENITLAAGRTIVRLRIEQLHLKPGLYNLSLWMARFAGEVSGSDVFDFVEKAFQVEVIDLPTEGIRTSIGPTGVVTCDLKVLEVSHVGSVSDLE